MKRGIKVSSAAPLAGNLSHVLVVMIDYHLGNFILSLPTINTLIEYFPDTATDVLVAAQHADLARRLCTSKSYEVLAYHGEKRRRRPKNAFRFAGLALRLLLKRYEAVMALSADIKTATITRATLAPRRIGFQEARRSFVYTKTIFRRSPTAHQMEVYADILQGIGRAISPVPIGLQTFPDDEHRLNTWLQARKIPPDARLAVIHPGAGYAFRCWPTERFVETADYLAREWNSEVVFIGSPKEEDFLRELAARMTDQSAHVFIQPLRVLLALFRRAWILVSNESGPTHLAATTDIPIVTLFGPTNETVWRPVREENVHILRGPRCDTCLWAACDRAFQCIRDVSVSQVLEKIDHAAKTVFKGENHERTPVLV